MLRSIFLPIQYVRNPITRGQMILRNWQHCEINRK